MQRTSWTHCWRRPRLKSAVIKVGVATFLSLSRVSDFRGDIRDSFQRRSRKFGSSSPVLAPGRPRRRHQTAVLLPPERRLAHRREVHLIRPNWSRGIRRRGEDDAEPVPRPAAVEVSRCQIGPVTERTPLMRSIIPPPSRTARFFRYQLAQLEYVHSTSCRRLIFQSA